MFIHKFLYTIVLSFLFVSQVNAVDDLPTVYFQCGDKEVWADFHDGDKLDLTIGRMTYVLSTVKSGSGAKYETPKGGKPLVVFWNKGREATIEIDHKPLPLCHQKDKK